MIAKELTKPYFGEIQPEVVLVMSQLFYGIFGSGEVEKVGQRLRSIVDDFKKRKGKAWQVVEFWGRINGVLSSEEEINKALGMILDLYSKSWLESSPTEKRNCELLIVFITDVLEKENVSKNILVNGSLTRRLVGIAKESLGRQLGRLEVVFWGYEPIGLLEKYVEMASSYPNGLEWVGLRAINEELGGFVGLRDQARVEGILRKLPGGN